MLMLMRKVMITFVCAQIIWMSPSIIYKLGAPKRLDQVTQQMQRGIREGNSDDEQLSYESKVALLLGLSDADKR